MTFTNLMLNFAMSLLAALVVILGIHRFQPQLLGVQADTVPRIVIVDHEALFDSLKGDDSRPEAFDSAYKRFTDLVDEYKQAGFLVLDSSVVRAAPASVYVHDDSLIPKAPK
ncbi:MAG: hypothetical protein E6Q76_07445 [Rhizobium sp.]|nr:MAG: hypothetical protein E6Q76_07445 [Rhizobium sp.]